MPDLLSLWAQRAAEHQHAVRACEAMLVRATERSQRKGLRISHSRQTLLAEFWRGMADRLEACPHLLPEAAVREGARHRILADLWGVVREELEGETREPTEDRSTTVG